MARTKFSIEEAFSELTELIEKLSDDSVSLADSMELYKKGVKLLDKCSATLDKTEKEMIILQEGRDDKDTARKESPGD